MRVRTGIPILIMLLCSPNVLISQEKGHDFLDGFIIKTPGQFNGYTNYWHSIFWEWQQYGNLFQLSLPDVAKTIAQHKVDTAEELEIPGLEMEEGFLAALLAGPAKELDDPPPDEVEKTLGESNVLIYVDTASEMGKRLARKDTGEGDWRQTLRSHQLNAGDFRNVRAFYLEKGERKLFIVLTEIKEDRENFRQLITGVRDVLAKYDLHRG